MIEHLATRPSETAHAVNEVTRLMRIQAETPPGNDPCMGAFYESLVSLVDSDPGFTEFFSDIYRQRPSLTPSHAVNLIFRSIQHLQLNIKDDLSYLNYESSDEWRPLLVGIFSSNDRNVVEDLMLKKDTITTKFQRYAGPKAIISSYWNGSSVNIADFGCGANLGLPGMEMNFPFQPITDETNKEIVLAESSKPTNIGVGLAIDKENPADSEVQQWSMACSYYPQELKARNGSNTLESDIKNGHNTAFLQADLLSPVAPHMIPKDYFDAVILSTVLYQRTEDERNQIISMARDAIKPTGILIIQDFAIKDPKSPESLEFNGAWGGGENGYRTFISRKFPHPEMLEVFIWADGRCTAVKPGEDISVLMRE